MKCGNLLSDRFDAFIATLNYILYLKKNVLWIHFMDTEAQKVVFVAARLFYLLIILHLAVALKTARTFASAPPSFDVDAK